jgi:Cu/Zn superoxide dismutase
MRRILFLAMCPLVVATLALTAGCEPADTTTNDTADDRAEHFMAEVRIEPTGMGNVSGHLTLTQERDDRGVRIEGHLTGIDPDRRVDLRIHEGTCASPGQPFLAHVDGDGQTAQQQDQQQRDRDLRERGLLGDTSADNLGRADISMSQNDFALSGQRALVNRILVVHGHLDGDRTTTQQQQDQRDQTTTTTQQQDGWVSNPIGCGQIQMMEGGATARQDGTQRQQGQ